MSKKHHGFRAALRKEGLATKRGKPSRILAAVKATLKGLRRAGAIERRNTP